MKKNTLTMAAQLISNWIVGSTAVKTPHLNVQSVPPGLMIPNKTHHGFPIYKFNHRKNDRNKYQPHQGKQECARRVRTGCGGYYMPVVIKGVA